MRKLVVLSGGLDSTVALAHALNLQNEVSVITFYYGSKHNTAENHAAIEVCKHYHIAEHKMFNLTFMKQFRSALTTPLFSIPKGHYTAENMSQTVVPGRNAILLSIAVGWAVTTNCKEVWYGAHSGDHAIYPDCREGFVSALAGAFKLGYDINLVAPFVDYTKSDIVAHGKWLNAPLELTYSCYEGDPDIHCGECGTCVERAEAFARANVLDPTVYRNPSYWKEVCK